MKRSIQVVLIVVVAGVLGVVAARVLVPHHATATAASARSSATAVPSATRSTRDCGDFVWTSNNSLQDVLITRGNVTCMDALKIANTYFNSTSRTPSGGNASETIGSWVCQQASVVSKPDELLTDCVASHGVPAEFIVTATGRTASPSASPSQSNQACGTVKDSLDNNTAVEVSVEADGLLCSTALQVANEYYNDPSDEPQGSAGISTFGGWTCESTSGSDAQTTGHYGDCTNGAERISLDEPKAQ